MKHQHGKAVAVALVAAVVVAALASPVWAFLWLVVYAP